MREGLKDTYKTLSDYDRHYSTVRATGVIFLFGLSFGIASFVLKDARDFLGNPEFVFFALMIPILFLVAAFFLSCRFQRLTSACQMYMGAIEKTSDTPVNPGGTVTVNVPANTFKIIGTIKSISSGSFDLDGTVSAPANAINGAYTASTARGSSSELDRCRKNLKALIKGDISDELSSLLTEQDKEGRPKPIILPQFFFFDLPNQILAVAFILLLCLPCLALALQQSLEVILWNLLPQGVGVILIIIGFVWKWISPGVWPNYMMVGVIASVFLGAMVWTLMYCVPNPPGTNGCDDGFKPIGDPVKSFYPGVHDRLEANTSSESLKDLKERIDEIKKRKKEQGCSLPMAIFVIGSTDRRHLKGTLELTYGGNAGLARERAEYIANEIKGRLPEVEVVSLITGSSWHGSENDLKNEAEMARDRSVAVYGLWAVKPVEGSGASKINN